MKKHILVVDDDKDIRDLVTKKLQEHHYIVTAAASGEETVKACTNSRPDLILLDIVLPDTDGYTLVKRLEDENLLTDTPVVFITGKDLEYKGIEDRLNVLGAVDYLRKPCLFEDILRKIQDILGAS